jgi:hypothetical protein
MFQSSKSSVIAEKNDGTIDRALKSVTRNSQLKKHEVLPYRFGPGAVSLRSPRHG